MKENFIVIDTETAGGLENPLAYDVGFTVVNRDGKDLERFSFVVHDIYAEQRELMKTAFYAEKLPLYEIGLKNGEYKMVTFFTIKKMIKDLMKKYNATKVYAYNMGFDRRALNNTQSFVTNNKYKNFFPRGTEFNCIWHMACQVLMARPSYIKWALKNGFISSKGNILTNAEVCYKYITKDLDFKEKHQGLADVDIEKQILMKCFSQHKKMDTKPYSVCWRLVQKKKAEIEASAFLPGRD